MDETGDRVRHAAVAKADMIEAWLDTMWEDVRATNERAGLDRYGCGGSDLRSVQAWT